MIGRAEVGNLPARICTTDWKSVVRLKTPNSHRIAATGRPTEDGLVLCKTIVEKPLDRDRFEEALRVSLADFFDIRSITFAVPASSTRDIREREAPAESRTAEKTVRQEPPHPADNPMARNAAG